ncbi:peroxiredoxin family protein [Mariniblastus sp.]|nr:peroxiredoxin family protein [Mariniblastus sp.]MDA7932771.1 peroxiredoxin family protein [Mariniblastus sp.]MDB2525943.1 peroxiredoxin family protein [Mariniblastus sp.]|eukprot:COSAG01_NODE_22_length_37888_cov_21.149012_7_plen_82_part_00
MKASGLATLLIIALVATVGCLETKEETRNSTPSQPKTYTVTGGPVIGELAPEIEGVDLDGVAFKLSDYRGKVVMLDFYGDW